MLAAPAFQSLQELTRASARAVDAQRTPTGSPMAAAS